MSDTPAAPPAANTKPASPGGQGGKGGGKGGKGGRGPAGGGKGGKGSGKGAGDGKGGKGKGGAPAAGGDWRQKAKKASRKNQIRSLERMLSREGVSDKIKEGLAMKLKDLGVEVDTHAQSELEKKRATK
jgi:hypothetical protein